MFRPSKQFLWALLAGLVAFSLGWLHKAPGLTLEDSGELAVALIGWGIPHPPGYPLYVLLGAPFTQVFGGTVSASNAFSVLCYSIGIFILARLNILFIEQHLKKKAESLECIIALMGAVFFFLLPHVFRQALITEVYGLMVLLTSLLLWHSTPALFGEAPKRFFRFGLLSGLVLSAHHIPIFLILILGLFHFAERQTFHKIAKHGLRMLIGLIVGLLPYAYLPLISQKDPILNWGNPSTWDNFWRVVTRKQYGPTLDRTFAEFVEQQREFVIHVFFNLQMAGLLLGVLGLTFVFNKSKALGIRLLALLFATGPLVAYGINFKIPPSGYFYFETSNITSVFFQNFYLLFSICLAILTVELLRRTDKAQLQVIIVVFALIGLGLRAEETFLLESKANDQVAQELVTNVEKWIPQDQGVILITNWDPFAFTILYAKLIEKRLPNVILSDVNFLKSNWYFDHLRKWNQEFETLSEGRERLVLNAIEDYQENRNGRRVYQSFDNLLRTMVHNGLNQGYRIFYFGLENFQTAPDVSPQIAKVPSGILTEYVHKASLEGYLPKSPVGLSLANLSQNLAFGDRLHRMLAGFYGLRALETAEWFASKNKKLSQDWLSFAEEAAENDPLLREEIEKSKTELHL